MIRLISTPKAKKNGDNRGGSGEISLNHGFTGPKRIQDDSSAIQPRYETFLGD